MGKFIHESLDDIFKPKSEEEIEELIQEGNVITAEILAKIINTSEIGQNIKVNFTGAWDKYGPVSEAKVITVNKGGGFEDALSVKSPHGTFIYFPQFKLESKPSEDTMLLFHAGEDSFFIKDIQI